MRTVTPKQNEKRIAENVKVRWDTAQALRIVRRALRTMLREGKQKSIYTGVNYGQSN